MTLHKITPKNLKKGSGKVLPARYTLLEEAIAWHRRAIFTSEGARCPVCQRTDKVYPRHINKASIRNLVDLYKHSEQHGYQFYHYTKFMPGEAKHSDFAKFKHIGLIALGDNNDPAKKTSGTYRMTLVGKQFVEGKHPINERLHIYHDTLLEVTGDRKTINGHWPNFNFAELFA